MYLITGKRTPFCKYAGSKNGGQLAKLNNTDLCSIIGENILAETKIPREEIEEVIEGVVFQTDQEGIYEARNIALKLNLSETSTALQVNRNCASGMQAIISAVQEFQSNQADLILTCGAENMSRIPHVARGMREANSFKTVKLEDYLFESLSHKQACTSMPETAENIAKKYQITRKEMDEYVLVSHQRALSAQALLAEEIVSIQTKSGTVSSDDGIRAEINYDDISKLSPVFREDGTVTAANACGIADGAVACLIASEKYVNERGLKPLAKIIDWSIVGLDPSLMGMGPVPAILKLLKKRNLKLEEIDLFEINEAFAAQYLAVEKELNLPRDKTNVNGGAIAIGHPLGASGMRIVLTLALELGRRKQKLGIASMCIGGGQGMAVLIEAC